MALGPSPAFSAPERVRAYDLGAWFYDLVVGSRLYHRTVWGMPPDQHLAFARRALDLSSNEPDESDGPILDAGCGSLLFTASTSGLVGSGYSPVYSMCKFGVVGFVKSLALRLARDNIRVNAVCPGPIDTPMLRVFVARPDQQTTQGMDKEELVRTRGGQTPMGRPAKPEEIANAALFLLSDEASFITGTTLAVDGGYTA